MMSNNDPRLQMVADFIKRQQLASKDNTEIKNESKRTLRLEKENRLLQERIDILAAALGACPICWGTDSTCPKCNGQGSVGSQYPIRDAYIRYVLPAVLRFGSTLLGEEKGGDPSVNSI